ncbi:hypothetical protein LINPERHAP2_LOCUS24022, partial [Linum perenne]
YPFPLVDSSQKIKPSFRLLHPSSLQNCYQLGKKFTRAEEKARYSQGLRGEAMESSSSSSSVITPEDVLECLMNDGTIDALRLKIINQLKANEELKNTTIKMAEKSKVLNTPGAEKQTKRELFDALRQELETPVLEKASKSVWELILDNSGLGKEISETVEKVFCRLSGQELPLFPPIPPKEKENKKEEEKEEAIASLRDKSASKMKKRRHSEMNKESQQGTEVAAKKSADLPPPPQQDRPSKSPPTSKTS